MSWDVLDNFELGMAGLADAADHAVGGSSTLAADLYASQTASANGLTPDQRAAIESNAELQEQTGDVLGKAASMTANQITGGLGSLVKYAEWGAAGAAGLVVLFVAWKAWRALA